ncbi:MAG TPA: hypothetical protein VFU15_08185, partial [Bacteroidia bacterium]|nr:hypothetical protein [Bacteroidia bacterium]
MIDRFFTPRRLGAFFSGTFLFLWLFPSLRLLLVGTHEMRSLFDIAVTVFPDMLVVLLLAVTLFQLRKRIAEKKVTLTRLDLVFGAFVLANVVYGFVLAMMPKYSLMSFRITYLP